MEHSEIESLLGAFALDAVEPDEATEIEEHLLGCPRCRAEVEGYREVAALLGDPGSHAPSGLWKRIADSLEDEAPSADIPRLIARSNDPAHRARTHRAVRWASALGAAAAAVAIALLGWQTANLENKLHTTPANAIAAAASSALAAPHRTVLLTSATRTATATVVITPSGRAYWVGSNLRDLPVGRTYQLWGLTDGRVVSLGLIGADPAVDAAFLLEGDVSRLMVTAEPEGGTTLPTTPVLVQATTAL